MAPFLETFHQTLAIVPVGFNELIMGFGFGWSAPTLQILTDSNGPKPLTVTPEQSSWIGSLMDFGRIFGPLISAVLLDKLGRKLLLGSCTVIFCIAWLMIILYKEVWAIYTMRLLFGIAMGVNDVSSSIYLAEVSSPKIRGFFCGVTMVASYSGELFEFIIATYFSYNAVAIVNAASSFVGVLSTFLLTESPQFLIMKGKLKKAEKNYLWLKGTNKWDEVNSEFEKIRQNIEEEKVKRESFWKLLSDKANRQSLIITLILNSLTMTTGFAAITSFASLAFSSSDILTPNEFTILFGVVQTLASFVAMLIIDRFNRRTLILASYALCVLSHIASAGLYFVHEKITPIEYFPWFIFVSISLYAAVYALLYPVVHIIRGELFPQSIKAIGGSVAIMTHACTGFMTAKMFLQVAELLGMYANFLFFALISITALFYAYFKLPETRGRTLVDIQKSMTT
ncbi:facilitated trehalose transporter Tret1-like [Planococcus citri]|uniref:facilitated trehalose transporter Tret1-like n=1 Tax=Planococcus citri TaxID=170843 RepID=UPI0031F9FD71